MMAALYALFTIDILFVIGGFRKTAIAFTILGLFFAALMFWHHATDILQINW